MELKPGYKLTEVGVIPIDWDVKRLREIVTAGPKNGYSGRAGSDSSGTPTLRLTATTSGYMKLNDQTIKRLDETIDPSSDLFLQPGDVLIQRSNTPDLVGTTAVFYGPPNTYVYPDLMIRLRVKDESTARWLWSYANSSRGRSYFVSVAAGSTGTMPKITGEKLRRMPIPFPPLAEQRAIAGALSDVDALIGALDQLLAKKRDLKQAAMQQLLTGHQRLPGFAPANPRFQQTDLGHYPSDWNLKPLGQLVDESRSIRYGIVQPGKYAPRGRLMIRGQDYSKGWVEPTEMFRVSDPIEERYRNARVQTGDLIITIVGAGTGTVETIPDWLDGANLTQTTARIAINDHEADSEFCKHILQTKVGTGQVANFIKGGAQPGLNCGDIKKFDIPMPPTVAEQTAIAEVLSDMDAELAALEQKRDKTRLLKQGMMQELLTGRTRLI